MTKPPISILLRVGVVIAFTSVCGHASPSETASPTTSEKVSSVEPRAAVNNPVDSSPAVTVNTESFDPAAATKAWLATVPRDQRKKSDRYFEGSYWLLLWNFLGTVAISIFLLESRVSAHLRNLAEHLSSKSLQIVCYAIPYFLIAGTLGFPLDFYEHFVREHQYGLATQSFLPWFREQLVGFGLTIIGGATLLIALYAVFRRAPRTWWVWGALVAVLFMTVVVVISPVFVEPLFNTYTPITNPEIRNPILAMAQANQIPAKQVFEVDASRQTTRVSANVAGFLGTTRIALNDNLLKQCTLPEIRAVMAHEMGHYVLNHAAKLLTYSAIFIVIGFALTRQMFDAAVKRWGVKWGVQGVSDPAGLPLLVLILGTLLFVATPLLNTVVRVTEREADAFGINTAREPDGMAKVTLKLGAYRKLDPTLIEEFIFFDHPSGRARIRMAMDWKAAHLPCAESIPSRNSSTTDSH
jgi:Zn-dependent protease with chaperone function